MCFIYIRCLKVLLNELMLSIKSVGKGKGGREELVRSLDLRYLKCDL